MVRLFNQNNTVAIVKHGDGSIMLCVCVCVLLEKGLMGLVHKSSQPHSQKTGTTQYECPWLWKGMLNTVHRCPHNFGHAQEKGLSRKMKAKSYHICQKLGHNWVLQWDSNPNHTSIQSCNEMAWSIEVAFTKPCPSSHRLVVVVWACLSRDTDKSE